MQKYAENWNEAGDRVRDIADGLPIYWGTGNPIREPHIVAFTKDAWSGEGVGYNVNVYPQGAGYRAPVVCHSIVVRSLEETPCTNTGSNYKVTRNGFQSAVGIIPIRRPHREGRRTMG